MNIRLQGIVLKKINIKVGRSTCYSFKTFWAAAQVVIMAHHEDNNSRNSNSGGLSVILKIWFHWMNIHWKEQ